MLIPRVFGQADALVLVVVQPVDLAPLLRKLGVHVPTKHRPAVVVVLFDIRVQIEIRDGFVDGV